MSATPQPVTRTTSLHGLHDNPTPQACGPNPCPATYATKSDKIVCVMVGLPARGKSYISRRLSQYIGFFFGTPTKVFNVGDYRRKASCGNFQSAEFFDHTNEQGLLERQRACDDALADLSRWMAEVVPNKVDKNNDIHLSGDFGAVAIFDATNSTRERRARICELLKPTGAKVIFIESVCHDPAMIKRNILHAKVGGKDYSGVETDAAVADFEARISKYEAVYEECRLSITGGL